MGTWGSNNFENDSALDWLDAFLWADNQVGFIAQAFQALAATPDFLDADDCRGALAGCEVIAALKGSPAPQLPRHLWDWIQFHQFGEVEQLLDPALKAIERVTAENSELRELWEESSKYPIWLAVQTDLQARLQS